MSLRTRIALSMLVLLSAVTTAAAAGPQKQEYFTEDELDLIRDAQELNARVSAYFGLAERRLVILGVAEKSEKQKEKERKAQERYDKELKKAGPKTAKPKPPEDEMAYLHDFTRAELLRGYGQAVDEVMANIDDNYSRKLDVRDALEELEKFTREGNVSLRKFQPRTDSERKALEETIEKSQQANDGARDALKKVPKTEKRKPVGIQNGPADASPHP